MAFNVLSRPQLRVLHWDLNKQLPVYPEKKKPKVSEVLDFQNVKASIVPADSQREGSSLLIDKTASAHQSNACSLAPVLATC